MQKSKQIEKETINDRYGMDDKRLLAHITRVIRYAKEKGQDSTEEIAMAILEGVIGIDKRRVIRAQLMQQFSGNAICHICNKEISPEVSSGNPAGLTIDHIRKLSDGGRTSIENCKLAHKACNETRDVEKQSTKKRVFLALQKSEIDNLQSNRTKGHNRTSMKDLIEKIENEETRELCMRNITSVIVKAKEYAVELDKIDNFAIRNQMKKVAYHKVHNGINKEIVTPQILTRMSGELHRILSLGENLKPL